jgi:HlyD family secretion protein
MKWLLAVLPALLFGAVLGGGYWWYARPAEPPYWQGYVDADFVRIGPTLQGLLTRVAVSRGDTVRAGQLLFTQDDANDRASRNEAAARLAETEARLANLQAPGRDTDIARAEADLADAKAVRERAEKDLARAEALSRTSVVSRQQLDLARADSLSANAKVQSAEARLAHLHATTGRPQEIAAQAALVGQASAQLAQAEWRLAQRRMTAPIGGLVNEVYARVGETVNAGVPVVSLLPPGNLLVRFFVAESEVPALRVGQPVAIGCDSCPPDLRGRISFIAPQAEYTPPVIYSESTRGKLVYQVEARPDAADAGVLKPGQPIGVRRAPP